MRLRRDLLKLGAATALPLIAGRAFAAEPEKLRIGYQKSSILTIFLKLVAQQRIADKFTQAQILPRRVVVADSPVWKPA